MDNRIVSLNHDGDKLTIIRLQTPYWLDLLWMLTYLAVMLCFLFVVSSWERHSGYQTNNAVLYAMTGVVALFNAPIIVPSLGGALSKKTYVFDRNAQGFSVNSVLVSQLSDVKQIEVQGRQEMRGNYRCRAVIKLADRRTVVIAETRRVESPFDAIKEADAVTKADKDKLPDYWVQIDRTHPLANGSFCEELFALQEAVISFCGPMSV